MEANKNVLVRNKKKWAKKKWADGCSWITCGARQRAATGVSLHELMERGGRAGGGRRVREGGREGGEGKERREGHWEREADS